MSIFSLIPWNFGQSQKAIIMIKNNKNLIFGLSIIFILIASLALIFAPNDVRGIVPQFDSQGNIVNFDYIITGPGGDADAHVNVNTRNLDALIMVDNKNTKERLFSFGENASYELYGSQNLTVNWCQNWSGPTGSYPTPNCVLSSGNLKANNSEILPNVIIPKAKLVPGEYQTFMPFTYYEIVPGKDDRVVGNYIDGATKLFFITTNTTLVLDNISNIKVGQNATITGRLTQDYDNSSIKIADQNFVNIEVGNRTYVKVYANDEGYFNYTVENLTAEDYKVKAWYPKKTTNTIYNASNIEEKDFKVNKILTELSLKSSDIMLGQEAQINGKLVDEYNNSMNNTTVLLADALGLMKYNLTTNESGEFQQNINDLKLGEYVFNGNYEGDNTYVASTNRTAFKVILKPIPINGFSTLDNWNPELPKTGAYIAFIIMAVISLYAIRSSKD
jgi:hypothetical protein